MAQYRPIVREPAFFRKTFNSSRAAWFWFLVRIWLGFYWIDAALLKIADPAWTESGAAIRELWFGILEVPLVGRPTFAYGWYRSIIQLLLDSDAQSWFGSLVAYSELLVGAALILGFFTGIAALFGGFMNWNIALAGAASSNPLLFLAALGLVMAWKVAGYVGLDYFLLPWLTKLIDTS